MAKAQRGDADAYRELLQMAALLIESYALKTLRRMGLEDPEAARDILQEALFAIHLKRHTYNPAQLFTPWMFAIARYKLIDYGRRRARQGKHDPLEALAELPDDRGQDALDEVDLAKLLQGLSHKQRQAIELVKVSGYSVAEASAQSGMSEAAVKTNVHRGIRRLRGLFGKGDPE
jgi:RNA polymerase sigma-70 factor (ECF subfamily)